MNIFEKTGEDLKAGLKDSEKAGVDENAYLKAMLWNLLQQYVQLGRSEKDIRDEVGFALDNLGDDETFHVTRN